MQNSFKFEFTQQEVQIIHEALMQLPMKVVEPLVNKLRAEVKEQEDASENK